MATLDKKDIPVEQKSLHVPPLDEIAQVLNENLTKYFDQVKVQVVECPDLTQKPFTLAAKGLGGSECLVEIGGVPYLLPKVQREKLYDIRDVAPILGLKEMFAVGAGAGPWPYAKVNCEMMVNLEIKNGTVNNHTRIAKVNKVDGSCILERLPDSECRSAVLSNLYCCEGKPGKVLEIHCKKRIAPEDFITSVRKTLLEYYKDNVIGIGGTFLLKEGKAKQHVMPDFSEVPINTEEELLEWLTFSEMSAPLIAVGHFVTKDPGLDLRIQHFHSFSHHGEGGHYHNDTTPDTAEYLAYFAVGKTFYRLDKPKVTHTMGRD